MAKTKEEALQELLKILCEHPDLAERIVITNKPGKLMQSEHQED